MTQPPLVDPSRCRIALQEANHHLNHAARLLAGVNQAYELGIRSDDETAPAEAAIAQAVTQTAQAYIRLAEATAALHDCNDHR